MFLTTTVSYRVLFVSASAYGIHMSQHLYNLSNKVNKNYYSDAEGSFS